MYLAHLKAIPGIKIVGIADLREDRDRKVILKAGYGHEIIEYVKSSNEINDKFKKGKICTT